MKPAGAVKLHVELCKVAEAKGACALHHRHLKKVLGGLVGVRVVVDGAAVAWGMLSRPVSRELQARNWLEFTRGIVPDGAPPNCASALLAFAARWAKKQGRPIVTYTLEHEPGTSPVAAGWVQVGTTRARKTWASSDRPERQERVGVEAAAKRRWVPSYCVDQALTEGFPLSPEPEPVQESTKIGDITLYARKATQIIPGLSAWLPGQPEILVYGVEAVEDLRAALRLSSVLNEVLVYRSREAPAPFPFEIPGDAKVEYSHGVWHIRRGKIAARATWFGGHTPGAPWYMSSDAVGPGSSVEWDVIGHWRQMHPIYEQKHNHVSMVAAYATLLEHLEVPMADADLGFALPYGGQALCLANDGSVLVFHPKRAAAWRILNGETFFAGSDGAPWAKAAPLTAAGVSAAWGDTGTAPARATPKARVWEVADAKDFDAPLAFDGKTSAKDLVILAEVDGEILVVSEDGEIDYDLLADMDNWTIFTAS
jgi:hypothetical protein